VILYSTYKCLGFLSLGPQSTFYLLHSPFACCFNGSCVNFLSGSPFASGSFSLQRLVLDPIFFALLLRATMKLLFFYGLLNLFFLLASAPFVRKLYHGWPALFWVDGRGDLSRYNPGHPDHKRRVVLDREDRLQVSDAPPDTMSFQELKVPGLSQQSKLPAATPEFNYPDRFYPSAPLQVRRKPGRLNLSLDRRLHALSEKLGETVTGYYPTLRNPQIRRDKTQPRGRTT
jgi:hypothetical protein